MKSRMLLVCTLPLVLSACSSDNSTPPATDAGADGSTPSNPEGGVVVDSSSDREVAKDQQVSETGQPDSATADVVQDVVTKEAEADVYVPDPTAELDEVGLQSAALQQDAKLLSVLPTIKGIIHLFFDESGTLDLTEDAPVNCALMLAHVLSTGGSYCPGKIQPQWDSGKNSLPTSFADCTAKGLLLKGAVEPQVFKNASGLTIIFTFNNLTANGFEFNGTVTVKTSDSTKYDISTDLLITDLGRVAFLGEGSISSPDAGGVSVSLDGTASARGGAGDGGLDAGWSGSKLSRNGWDCVQSGATSYRINQLKRNLSECYASGGTAWIDKSFDCTKTLGLRTLNQTVNTEQTLTWLAATPTDGKVSVRLNSMGDAGSGGEVQVALPWTCPTPVTPEPQPEAGVDADTTDAAAE